MSQTSYNFEYRDRFFHEDDLFICLKEIAKKEGFVETDLALDYMKERHKGQFRKKAKHTTTKVAYINHPLTMAYQAYSFQIKEDAILAAILLHDVVEDTGVTTSELPFSDEVKQLVDLVTFQKPEGMTKKQAKVIYFSKIKENPKASIIKLIDRCNNVSTMAASFTNERLVEYIEETENYILPLADLPERMDEYKNTVFLLKYQIYSVLETIKNLL